MLQRTEASCVLCSALRGLRDFSPRFLDSAEAIAAGEREPLLGLLEDCHRFADGYLPAPIAPPGASKQVPSHRLHGNCDGFEAVKNLMRGVFRCHCAAGAPAVLWRSCATHAPSAASRSYGTATPSTVM